jgi:hypothetical protein
MRRRTPPQIRISQSKTRYNIGVWGRQSGKTTFGLDVMIYKPIQGRDNGIYWYILQTYSAATIAFKRFLKLIQNTEFFSSKNKSERSVTFDNGASVFFKSGKNFEDLRAETLDGVVIDEVRQQHKDLWPMIIRPMLGRREAWAYFLSTTNGFDHFKDLVDFAQGRPDWSIFHAPSTEAWWWTPKEIADAKATMSEDVFEQEIMAGFREIGVGKVYKSHGAHNQKVENPLAIRGYEWSPYLPIIVGLDFNVGLMVWELGQRKGSAIHYGDEIAVENTDTEQCALILAERVKDHKPGIVLIGDASGNARRTSAVGETDYKIIKRVLKLHGILYEDKTPKENPFIKDRVNAFNSMLKAADGTVKFTYNPLKCKYLKRDLERVKWKQGADGAFLDKSDPLATHASDAAGYPVCLYNDDFKSRPGLLHVIPR